MGPNLVFRGGVRGPRSGPPSASSSNFPPKCFGFFGFRQDRQTDRRTETDIHITKRSTSHFKSGTLISSELSFLKQGRPRTYLLRLSVCPSCLKPKKPKHFGETFDDDAEGGPLRGPLTPPRKTKFGL